MYDQIFDQLTFSTLLFILIPAISLTVIIVLIDGINGKNGKV